MRRRKNGQHSNQKARQSAKEKIEEVKKEYETLKSKPNKTKEDAKMLEKLKTSATLAGKNA